ncbi:MAG: response regulator transcription factor [Cyanobacteria bacterium J06639_1]
MSDMRIVLVEDHDLTRMGLKAALQQAEIDVIGEATTAAQGLSVLQASTPDVAIVDIGLPDRDGIDLTRSLRQWQKQQSTPAIRVLILTMQDSEEAILAAFAAGADSYCLKDISGDRLLEALKATHEGNGWIDPAIANVVLKHVRQASPTAEQIPLETVTISKVDAEYAEAIAAYPLSERETEVLELIVAGYSNSQIGKKLFISMGTVKTHVRHILDKLCASDRTQAAVRALRSGLVK